MIVKIFTILSILLYLGLSQDSQQDLTKDDLWFGHINKILSPEGVDELIKIALTSAKSPNQLGDFDSWNTEGLEYVLLSIKILPMNVDIIRMGICSPREWNTEKYYSTVLNLIQDKAEEFLPDDLEIQTSFVVPRDILAESMSTGAIIVLTVIGVIIFLWLLGILVTYTNLGSNGNFRSEKVEERKTKWALALHSFNPVMNLQKLFTVKDGGDQTLNVLNGVRVLSIGWVIVGHSFSFVLLSALTNMQTISVLFQSDFFSIVPAGVLAVDTFFFLSGFLTFALLVSKLYPKGTIGWVNTFLLYFHRYYRLIFPIVFIQFFTMFVFRYLGNGPMYRTSWDALNQTWFDNPWSNFLFISNFVPWQMNRQCIGWVWYLMCDFQFFVISPPLLILYCKNRKIGKIIILALIIFSMGLNGAFTLIWDISIQMKSAHNINPMDIMYNKPWSRMGAYFVGAIFGLSYFEMKNSEKYQELSDTFSNKYYTILKNSRVISLMSWCFGIGLTALYVFPNSLYLRGWGGDGFQTDENCWALFPSFLYNATSRPVFVLGVGLIIAPTFVGRLRVIKTFLGAQTFEILARLNYMVYMIHCNVIWHFLYNLKAPVYATSVSQWFFAIGVTIVSFIASVPLTLICEVPFMNIEKFVLFPKKLASQKENIQLEPEKMTKREGNHFYKLEDQDETLESRKNLLKD